MIKIFILTITLFLFGCNTIVGSVKGVGRDMKAATVYTRDAFTGNPISDESSNWLIGSEFYVWPKLYKTRLTLAKILIYDGETGIRTFDSVATIHTFQACWLEKS